MKLEMQEDDILIILKEEEIKKIDFEDIDKIESYFRDILLKLKKIYDIDINGFYNIHVYVDKREGMVLKLEKEYIDYYDSFHQIEMRIIKEDVTFLYEIDDILALPYQDLNIYIYNDKFYVKRKNKKKLYSLYEFGKLIYNNTEMIIKNGKEMTIL